MKKVLQNKLFQQIGIYTTANVISKGVPFFMLPILTDYLTEGDFGIYSNFLAVLGIIVPFVGVNAMASVSRMYVKEDVDRSRYVSTGFWLISILAMFFSALMFLFATEVEALTEVPKEIVWIISFYAWLTNVNELILSIWRMEDKPLTFGLFSIGRTVLEIGISIVFIVGLEMNYEGRILGLFLTFTLFTLIAVISLLRKRLLTWAFNKIDLKSILNFGLPLIPHVLSATVIMFSDKLFITNMINIESNGVYSVAFQVGLGIALLQTSFNQAWIPWFYKKMENPTYSFKIKIVKVTYLYFIGILLCTLILWLITPFIFKFIGKDFQAGMELVLWVALGFAFNGMYKMVGAYLFYLEKTKVIAYLSIISAIVNIILNFYLIPLKGIEGAALATMMTLALQFVLVWIIAAKLYPMPWTLKKI